MVKKRTIVSVIIFEYPSHTLYLDFAFTNSLDEFTVTDRAVCLIEEQINTLNCTIVELISTLTHDHETLIVTDGWLTPGVYQKYLH